MNRKAVKVIIPLGVAAGFILAACGADPIEIAQTGNSGVSAAKIAVVDGCNIWRIKDGTSETVYFAKCSGEVQTTMHWEDYCGKGCVKDKVALSVTKE